MCECERDRVGASQESKKGGGEMRENANIGRQDAVIEMHALSYNVRRQELETLQKVLLSSHSA